MLKITIGDKTYNLPLNWNEVELEKIVEAENPKEILQKATGIPLEIFKQLTYSQLFELIKLITFIQDPESMEGVLIDVECPDIEQESWQKLIEAQQLIKTELWKTFYYLCKVYCPEEKKTVRQLSKGYKLLNQITLFLSHYKEMFEDEPEGDEIQAGIQELQVFGSWGTAFNMAGKDILKMDAVLQQPAISIYTALYYSFKERKYQERLIEIKQRKA